MMTHDEMIAVIAAHKEGKRIQFKHKGTATWYECNDPNWGFDAYDYRIKPEPREPRVIWVNEYEDGLGGRCEATKEEIISFCAIDRKRIGVRKFIEVIDEE